MFKGLAWVGEVCRLKNEHSAAVFSDKGLFDVNGVAHEIGHVYV